MIVCSVQYEVMRSILLVFLFVITGA